MGRIYNEPITNHESDECDLSMRKWKEELMMMKKFLAGALVAGMFLSTNLISISSVEAAEMNEKHEAVKIVQTAGRKNLGDLAPDFARYNDDILFGEVWSRNDILSLHDRSIATISGLMGAGVTGFPLKAHLEMGKKHGISKDEMVELITQNAFYLGWPKAWMVFPMVREVYDEDAESEAESAKESDEVEMTLDDINRVSPFKVGSFNEAYAKYFDGASYLSMMTTEQAPIGNVTFAPGCRNHWHVHHATQGGGQILVVTAGRGYYQEWGKPVRELHPGDVVNIPANVKHWHGAAPHSAFQHLSIEVPGENTSNEWLEPVDEDMYNALK